MLKELFIAFTIVGLCLALHISVMVNLARWLMLRSRVLNQQGRIANDTFLLMLVFSLIIFLHMAESFIWATFYYLRGLFGDFETSLYFSLASYTTIGYGDVVLQRNWRLLGTIEGISGVLLCGLSAAFIFAIVNALFRNRNVVTDESPAPVFTRLS
jgi:voltage-gated potassium channel